MQTTARFSSALIATLLISGSAWASSHGNDLVHNREFKGQTYTMNQFHMALYTYDGDAKNVSNCYGDCAVNWPPALLAAGAKLGKNYALMQRGDGSQQITFRGKPLYLFINDTKIGDLNGDGIGGVWHLSKP